MKTSFLFIATIFVLITSFGMQDSFATNPEFLSKITAATALKSNASPSNVINVNINPSALTSEKMNLDVSAIATTDGTVSLGLISSGHGIVDTAIDPNPLTTTTPKTTLQTFTVPLPDTTPPTITVPADFTTEATAIDTPLTQSDYGTATATDNKVQNPTITNNAPDTFPIGDTTITWSATDESGNSVTGTQVITVQDTVVPTFNVSGNADDYTTDIELGTLYTRGTIQDIVDISTTTESISGTVDYNTAGDYLVTYTVTDAHGNSAAIVETVTVQDPTLSATITTPSNSIVNTESFIISGTSTNANNIGLYREGTYTRDWVVPDSSGNWSFTVTLSEGENVLGVIATKYGDADYVVSPNDIIVTFDPVTQSLLLDDSFETSLDGWQKYSFIGTYVGSLTPFDNYELSLNSTAGRPSPSAHISGDGFVSRSGIQKTVDISSVDGNSPLYLSLDYRAKSGYASSAVTNTHLVIFDGVTGVQLHSQSLIAGGTRDSGWQSYNTDISDMTSGYDSITIRLYMQDLWSSNWNQQNWYDNITISNSQQTSSPQGQASPSNYQDKESSIPSDDMLGELGLQNGTNSHLAPTNYYINEPIAFTCPNDESHDIFYYSSPSQATHVIIDDSSNPIIYTPTQVGHHYSHLCSGSGDSAIFHVIENTQ